MVTQWVISSTALPYEGEAVEFVVQDREAVMGGSFANLMFRSRWSGYSAHRVQSWRRATLPDQLP